MRECSINIKAPHLSAVQCGCAETCFLYRDVKLWHRMQRSLFKSVMWWRLMCGHVVLMAEHLLSNMLPCNADKVVTWGMPDVLVPRLRCYSLLRLFLCVGSEKWIHWSCQEDTVECKQGNLYVREACRTAWMLFCGSPAGTCRICSRGLMRLHSFRCSPRWEPARVRVSVKATVVCPQVWLWGVLWMDLDASVDFRFPDTHTDSLNKR